MFFNICNTTRQTIAKHDTCHMTYYSVNITIRDFKEAIHRNVDKDPYTPSGTIPGMPHVNPYVPHVKIQVTRTTYPVLVTNLTLHGIGGFPQGKSGTFQHLRPRTITYNMAHAV